MRQTRIFRNLHYRWTFAGLGPEDLAMLSVPSILMMFVGPACGLSQIWTVVLFATLAVTLAIFKRGKPPGYIEGLLTSALMPKVYSHKERDRVVRPFPISPDACTPARLRTQKPTVSSETV
jgi:hypothetical protein